MPRLLALALAFVANVSQAADRPSVLLLMADDLGYGDTGFNGNRIIKTPHLDRMAREGIHFTRFYAAAPVCSPTRASCLTGRHPYRTGVFSANVGILRPEEITLAEVLRDAGYATGHFGKWHLGTLTKDEKDSNRGGRRHPELFNPPTDHGFDTYFSTEAKVPTWDPMRRPPRSTPPPGKNWNFGWNHLKEGEPSEPYGTAYWTPNGKASTNLDGDDSRVIMDRVLPFIERATDAEQPFFAVVWFHAPHLPVVAGPKYAAMYDEQPFEMQQFAGCVTAMDEQIGRLRDELERLGVANDTMIWFCSDNGPEGDRTAPGDNGGFRGRKRSLHEGGVRVPAVMVWPSVVEPRTVDAPVVTSDYLPTILEAVGVAQPEEAHPLDGVSVLPLLIGKAWRRPSPVAFVSGKQLSLVGDRLKLYGTNQLYDLLSDPSESTNLAGEHPEVIAEYLEAHSDWYESCRASFEGGEYGTASLKRVKQAFPARDGRRPAPSP